MAALSWAEADAHLAQAWAEAALLARNLLSAQRAGRKGPAQALAKVEAALECQEIVTQELAAALRVRGLEPIGRVGEVSRFDPDGHCPDRGRPAPGAEVRVVSPGVRRVAAGVVLPARVRPIRRRGR